MCIELPAVVIGLDGAAATVETDGRIRRASTLLLPDVTIGEWVLIAAGTIVSRIEPAAAEQLRRDVARARGVTA